MVRKMNVSLAGLFFLFLSVMPAVYADSLAVKGNYALLADGNLKVYNIKNPSDTGPRIITVGGAIGVAVSGSNAIVTAKDEEGNLSIKIVDLTPFMSDSSDDPDDSDGDTANDASRRFISTYDSKKGTITIPSVATDSGKSYMVIMQQQGNSNNWEVIFTEEFTDDTDSDEPID